MKCHLAVLFEQSREHMARIRYLLERAPEQGELARYLIAINRTAGRDHPVRALIAEAELYLEKIGAIDADRVSENSN
jgi:hypothetical protein